jgi:glucose-1-phosphate cytidylyltransferase
MVPAVTKSEARDAKKTAAPANSSGLPKRPAGVRVIISWHNGGLCDVNLSELVDTFLRTKKIACFVSVKLRASFHLISVNGEGVVKSIDQITKSGARINGGFFIFRCEIFRYIKEGDELCEQPFR